MRVLLAWTSVFGIAWALYGCAAALLGIPLGIGQLEFQARQAQKPCAGQPCDPNAWLLIEPSEDERFPSERVTVVGAAIDATIPGLECIVHEPLPFVDPYRTDTNTGELLTALRVRRDDLKLVVLTDAGRVYVAGFAATAVEASGDLDAVGIAWANRSGWLAVPTPDRTGRGTDAFVLRIMDDSLDERAAVPFELIATDKVRGRVPLVVSWSADDRWVAVSTPGQVGSAPVPPAACTLISIDDGRMIHSAVHDAYFLGTDRLVASEAVRAGDAPEGHVYAYRLAERGLTRISGVSGAVRVLTSDPVTGVFVSIERPPPFISPTNIAALRTLETGPQLLRPAVAPGLSIVPWNEQTRNVLNAVGLNPEQLRLDPSTGWCVSQP